jgi:hypothetical protein
VDSWQVFRDFASAGLVKRTDTTNSDTTNSQLIYGELSQTALLMCRIRYFSQGVAIGSREFVENVFEEYRERFSTQRKEGARKVRTKEGSTGLFALRDVR